MQSFLESIEWIQTALTNSAKNVGAPNQLIPWSWTASQLCTLASQFPTGLTQTIILSEIESQWLHVFKNNVSKYQGVPNTTSHSSDSLVSQSSIFHLKIERVKSLQTACQNATVLVLGNLSEQGVGGTADPTMETDGKKIHKFTIDLILHSKFKFLFDTDRFGQDWTKNGLSTVRFTSALITKRTPSIHPRFLPTEHLIFVLSESKSSFTQQLFSNRLKDATFQTCASTIYSFLLTITSISPPITTTTQTTLNQTCKTTTRRIQLLEVSTGKVVDLVLRDADTKLADLVEVNDVLGIHNPYVHEGCFQMEDARGGGGDGGPGGSNTFRELEYGLWTVLFCIPATSANSPGEAVKDVVPVDENGYHDFKMYPSRFKVKDIQPNQKNISLLGTIVHLTSNMPIQKGGKKSDRFGIRLMDGDDGTHTDITLWDEVGLANRQLQIGQIVFIQNLSTNLIVGGGGGKTNKCYVVGNAELGTKLFCLSTSVGFLTSPILRNFTSLEKAVLLVAGFYCRAKIVSWRVLESGHLTEYIHPICGKPLETKNEVLYCRFCSIFPHSRGTHAFQFIVQIQDAGSRSRIGQAQPIDVAVQGRVADEVLGVSAPEFNAMDNQGRLQVLENLCGREFDFSVSVYRDKRGDNALRRRVDAVCQING